MVKYYKISSEPKINKLVKKIIKYLLIMSSIFLISCGNTEEIIDNPLKINSGSIIKENLGKYEFYNLINNSYSAVENNNIPLFYDIKSNNYIFNENGEIKLNYFGKKLILDEEGEIIVPKLSIGGNYISYFVKEDFLKLIIKDLSNSKLIKIDSNVAISGYLVDWLNEDTIIYYGVDKEKNNGIFSYNIKEKKEELLYKLDIGFIEFLKVDGNKISFVQVKENHDKVLKILDESGKIIDEIDKILDISDIEIKADIIYFLGKIESNDYSLYKHKNNITKRLIYDFPKIINLEKGLSKDYNGNILFMGSDENYNLNGVYLCEDETISIINSNESNYYFIEFK
ncbi:hypothetical protein [Caproiciproducens sp. MSJ-32]|uniref:hypothetical protein n=1 Tax=Caproiciproducens sp. MSJ-32 TaxID=2841527 RepID=UPI0025706975|nr:hypothetical protein [Caproiciproducens sp. MSJ-32]